MGHVVKAQIQRKTEKKVCAQDIAGLSLDMWADSCAVG